MTEKDYHQMQTFLISSGVSISECRFDEKAFGCWYIYIESTPRKGIVWDGKDRQVIFCIETDKFFNESIQWEDKWVEKNPEYQTVENIFQKFTTGKFNEQPC